MALLHIIAMYPNITVDRNVYIGLGLVLVYTAMVLGTLPLFIYRRYSYPIHSRNTPLLMIFVGSTAIIVYMVSAREILRPANFPCFFYLYTIFSFPVSYALPQFLRGIRAYFRTQLAQKLLDDTRISDRYNVLVSTRFLVAIFVFVYFLHLTGFLLEYLLVPTLEDHFWSGCELTTEWLYFSVVGLVYVGLVLCSTVSLYLVREHHYLKHEMLLFTVISVVCGGGFIALQWNDVVFAAVNAQVRVSYLISIMCILSYGVCVIMPLAHTYRSRSKRRFQTRDFVETTELRELSQVLHNTERIVFFKRFVVEEGCHQFYACWVDTIEYRTTTSAQKRHVMFLDILRKYIMEDAPLFIDVNNTLPSVNTNNFKIRASVDKPQDLFDTLREQLYQYMNQHLFPRFVRSIHFQELAEQMMLDSGRLQHRKEQAAMIDEDSQGLMGSRHSEEREGDLPLFPELHPTAQGEDVELVNIPKGYREKSQ